ncbi:hypothetical protein MPTK1_4g17640 [Marchantia polymorpha subsp. ruderalis]|uniref:Uncharacterized protein n=2 Tax=Marchantia polymorpha TaxID=3197 RepID=A0AAF6BAX2_MARPO|nr:hypothetical protein MARPO_0041s0046 [Marchantia polymorpha]BBN09156.1 hypothetical protein Mp_4g17640 [Marchantia polymorpha subsp. ruderalis]|eukprot:PTQ40144.1 hypothetical protein MARPO_0041s0046 [Marchantia polymorpha]
MEEKLFECDEGEDRLWKEFSTSVIQEQEDSGSAIVSKVARVKDDVPPDTRSVQVHTTVTCLGSCALIPSTPSLRWSRYSQGILPLLQQTDALLQSSLPESTILQFCSKHDSPACDSFATEFRAGRAGRLGGVCRKLSSPWSGVQGLSSDDMLLRRFGNRGAQSSGVLWSNDLRSTDDIMGIVR